MFCEVSSIYCSSHSELLLVWSMNIVWSSSVVSSFKIHLMLQLSCMSLTMNI